MATIRRHANGRWQVRYKGDTGKWHAKHFVRKIDAQQWLDEQTAKLVTGTHVDPRTARTTVGEWCDTWLAGYQNRRATTVRQAEVHLARIRAAFGPMTLARSGRRTSGRGPPSSPPRGSRTPTSTRCTRGWRSSTPTRCTTGSWPRSPCSRRTSPAAGKQRAYVATTEQVWALHDAMPEHLRAAVLLGAFAGLRLAEACGLGWPTWTSCAASSRRPSSTRPSRSRPRRRRTPMPIPQSLALTLSRTSRAGRRETRADQRVRAASSRPGPSSARCGRRAAKVAGLPRRLPLPRPAALLRVAAHRQRRRREGRPGAAPARLARRRRSTPTATCGRTPTTAHEPPSKRCWRLVRTIVRTDAEAGEG